MRLQISMPKEPKHSELVSCAGWASSEEVYSAADDHKILRWLSGGECSVFITLSDEVFPTDMHWLPKFGGGKKTSSSESLALTSTDGKLHIISKTGRIEKVVESHQGAALAVRWSYDGTALVTAGEDGQVKIWSRSGMLRSTLAQNAAPVYSISWSPDSDTVLYTLGRQLVIKPLQPNAKQTAWKAHDGVVLKADWNVVTGLILSGGEDCRYKVWDAFGRQLYSSQPADYPVTSLAWTPNGELFVIGSFNTIRLCDRTGWSYSLERANGIGSAFALAWSADSTQLAAACGNGQVISGHIVDRRVEWRGFEATVIDSRTMLVRSVVAETKDKLDFRDRVIKMSMAFGHLVVATSSQCYIYSTRNFNTPVIIDLKEGAVTCIVQAEKSFALVDNIAVYVYSYDGRLACSPRYPSLRADSLNASTLALADDTIAIRDRTDEKVVYLFESTGKAVGDGQPFSHKEEIVSIALDQCDRPNERRLAFVDKNRELYLANVRVFGTARRAYKIGSMIETVKWNDGANLMVALGEGTFSVYYYANAVFSDRNLLPATIISRSTTEFGKNLQLVSFDGALVTFRRHDGSLVSTPISPYAGALHSLASAARWDDAVALCRFVKDPAVWASLAAMAAYSKNVAAAEVAYAALNAVDKVQLLHQIREQPSKELQNAELAQFCGNVSEAEAILLQAGRVFRAIHLNIQLYNWDRALELATKHKTHVDTVVAYRQRYLTTFERKETNPRFEQLADTVCQLVNVTQLLESQVKVDWDVIEHKVSQELGGSH